MTHEEAISREAVMSAICDYVAFEEYEDKSHTFTIRPLTERIKQLPSVTQKSIECDDAIDREELLKAIDTWDKFGVDGTNSLFRLDNLSLPYYVPYIHYDDVIECIKGMPPVTQKSGK